MPLGGIKDREKLKLQQLLNLQGVIENIIFHSEQTGFTVVELDSNGELVTMVGELPDLSCGEEIIATGTFVHCSPACASCGT